VFCQARACLINLAWESHSAFGDGHSANGGRAVFDADATGFAFPAAAYLRVVLQMVAASAVLVAIDTRLRRPLRVGRGIS
jgi:hypothetical protein